jgi:hypothetical protein
MILSGSSCRDFYLEYFHSCGREGYHLREGLLRQITSGDQRDGLAPCHLGPRRRCDAIAGQDNQQVPTHPLKVQQDAAGMTTTTSF